MLYVCVGGREEGREREKEEREGGRERQEEGQKGGREVDKERREAEKGMEQIIPSLPSFSSNP